MRSTKKSYKEKPYYPLLLEGVETGVVVLFAEDACGTVIHTGLGVDPVGYYRETWNIKEFLEFDGSILLEN